MNDYGKADVLKDATAQIDKAVDEAYDPETEKSADELISTLEDQSNLRLDLKRHEAIINQTLDLFLVNEMPVSDPSTLARAQMCIVA